MILQEFEIDKYGWVVDVFYVVDLYCKEAIESYLEKYNCDKETKEKILKLIDENKYNKGVTYTNPLLKKSIIIIGPTTSTDEFANTYDHEKGHLVMHLSKTNNIEPFSEEYQYLAGEVAKLMFPLGKTFMCELCREDLFNKFKRREY